MFPLVADGPMDNEVFPAPASVTQSIIGVVNFVVALTLVPLSTVEDELEPTVMTFAVEEPVPMLIAPNAVLWVPVPILISPSVCIPPRLRSAVVRFCPSVIAVAAVDESNLGAVNLVVTFTPVPFKVVSEVLEPMVTVLATVEPVLILISPVVVRTVPVPILIVPSVCKNPMVREPVVRLEPTVVAVPIAVASYVDEVILVPTSTEVPLSAMEFLKAVPIVIALVPEA